MTEIAVQSEFVTQETQPWWRTAVVYQVYIRSFADGNGDGIGDIAGLRAQARLPGRPRRRRGLDQPLVPVADGRRRLRRRRLPRHRTRLRHPRRGGGAASTRPTPRASGCILDIVPNHTSDQHAWFQARCADEPGARDRYIFRPGRGADGELPPNDWQSVFGGPAWTPGLADGDLVPAPVRPRAARPQLGAPRGARRVRGHAALLVRPRRRRLPHRRRTRPGQGSGHARRGGAPTVPHHVDAHPAWDQDGVHEVYRGWRAVAELVRATTDLRRRGVGARATSGWRATCGPTSCTPRSSSTSCARRGAPIEPARRDRRRPRAAARVGRRAADLGAVQPRRTPHGDPLRPLAARAPGRVGLGARPLGRRAARPRTRSPPRPRGRAAAAGAARHGLRLPGRGAGARGGRGPARRGAPGPDLGAVRLHRRRPRRLPGAAAVVGDVSPYGFSVNPAARRGCRSRRGGVRSRLPRRMPTRRRRCRSTGTRCGCGAGVSTATNR